ncbi:MAG: tRNA (adenosine(37)-N6)-threonylcarbamoyltransferase complex ATPase subunit type 1 TsaE [Lentimicrobiaceae bacterium]|jgi:tRNA threonylcarbamoyladenosine biosynthesis protein TsaE|nr:tRNA (adenosine(37)-N6)-threonylcarbamoyltransferase complex ATPase subunit type 1 TsaE [Lentimicrobiaceae bacterium]
MKIICKTPDDLLPAAHVLLETFPQNRVFAFQGEMGAGKTTFIKIICHLLGSDEVVNSPTFSIINEYFTSEGTSLFHFDFYRLKKQEEAVDMGVEEYLYSGAYCFIEWPEKIHSLLPANIVKVEIKVDEIHKNRLIIF